MKTPKRLLSTASYKVISGKAVILDEKQWKTHTLNDTATYIFLKYIEKGLSVEEIVSDLSADYHIDFKKAERDVRRFFEEMKILNIFLDTKEKVSLKNK